METTVDQLGMWGWDARVGALFEPHMSSFQPGRVLSEHRGGYVVATDRGEVEAAVSGRYRHEASSAEEFPAVGDWVALDMGDGEKSAVIHALVPRKTRFLRPARGDLPGAQVVAANVDVVLLVAGLDHDFNLRRLERYVALAWSSGAEPVIVLNKADICDDVPGRSADVAQIAPGVPIRVLSALDGLGLDSLTPLLEAGKTIALIGSSGVGKSTILNRLLGTEQQRTQDVRADDRGRHTTTHRELVPLPGGGLVIDTPGIRELQLWDADEGLGSTFADIEALAEACRFTDCRHETEPGCEILRALGDGSLTEERLESYRKLQKELAYLDVRQDARARSERRKEYRRFAKEMRARMKGGGR